MTTTVSYLIDLCRATDVQPQPDLINNMARVLDGPTVAAMIDLMQGKDMQAVFFALAKRSLTPMEDDTLSWVIESKFVSSRETSEQFEIQASTAVNRLNLLERKGVLTAAFDWLPAGGGSRKYYRVASGPLDPASVETFAKALGTGRVR